MYLLCVHCLELFVDYQHHIWDYSAMKTKTLSVIAGLAVAFALPFSSFANVLPVNERFEVDLSKFTPSGDGVVALTTAQAIQGQQSVLVSNAVMTLDVAGSNSKVWIRLYARPGLYDDSEESPQPANEVAAAFYINTDGDLKAYSDAAWVTVKSGLNTSGWIGLAAQLDYDNGRWDIYYDDSGVYGQELVRANGSTLLFNAEFTGNHITGFAVDSGLPTYIDELSLIATNLEVPEEPDNTEVVVKTLEIPQGASILAGLAAGFATQYLEVDGSPTLLGAYLLSLMNNGDRLLVQSADNGGSLSVLERLSADGVPYWNDITGTAAATLVGPATGVQIQRLAGDTVTTAFRKSDGGNLIPYDVPLFGTDNATRWTALASPQTGSRSPADMNFANAVNDDRVFVYDGDSVVQLRYLNGGWRQGGAAPSYQFTQGQVFYYRRNAGGTTWNP